jgi:hypothetical protein
VVEQRPLSVLPEHLVPVKTPPAPTTSTTELVRFLLARLDDDTSALKRVTRKGDMTPAAIVDAPRMRAELEAKRQVIGTLQQQIVLRDQPFEKVIRHQAVHMLRALALPYADHTAYRKEWALSAPM